MALDLTSIRRQFPLLTERSDILYLDSAATSQKPLGVLDSMMQFYRRSNGNAHRGMHPLAEEATQALEGARTSVQKFLNSRRSEEIIFTKSCTEAINLVAHSLGRGWKHSDMVVTTQLEHHSNIVPWLQLKESKGISVEWIPCSKEGVLDLTVLERCLSTGSVRLVTVTAQSNVLGVRPDIQEIIRMAHAHSALVLIDAAQAIAHMPFDMQKLDADFLVFSAHKMYGPLGIGVLASKRVHLEAMPPFLGGGMMIHEVTQDGFSPAEIPMKFEAGTQPIAEAAGLASAIAWLSQFGWNDIQEHENQLIQTACAMLHSIPSVHLLGPENSGDIHGCVSFTMDGVHPHDLTDALGKQGICLRAGHHCAQPLHRVLGIDASTRLSVGIYNTKEEIAKTVEAIRAVSGSLSR